MLQKVKDKNLKSARRFNFALLASALIMVLSATSSAHAVSKTKKSIKTKTVTAKTKPVKAESAKPESTDPLSMWHTATRAGELGQNNLALTTLKKMKESGQTEIGQDLIQITVARVLYQKGDVEAAVSAYSQVPKASSLWVEAMEERAWAHLRLSQFDNALGDVTTVLSPVLAPLTGPEPFFLAHLLAYRVCDYVRLFKNSETFKTRHRQRLIDLQDLAKTGSNRNFDLLLTSFKENGLSQDNAGAQIESLPRTFVRDRHLKNLIQTLKDKPSSDIKSQIAKRAQILAQRELKEYKIVLNKMHIIEAEVIERLHMDDSLKGPRMDLAQTDDGSDKLIFPADSKEVWMDELGQYKAQVKECPGLKGASL